MSVPQDSADRAGVYVDGVDGVETFQVDVLGNTISGRKYGSGLPVLLVHGLPRTSLMWRSVAPQLATNYTVIAVDLRVPRPVSSIRVSHNQFQGERP